MKKELKDLESAIRRAESDATPADQKENLLARAAMTAQEEKNAAVRAKRSALWTWVPIGAACAVVVAAAAVFLPRIGGEAKSESETPTASGPIDLFHKSDAEEVTAAATTTVVEPTGYYSTTTAAMTYPMTIVEFAKDAEGGMLDEKSLLPAATYSVGEGTVGWIEEPSATWIEEPTATWIEEPTATWTEPTVIQPRAGLLTAGEWNDNDNLEFWKQVQNRNDWHGYQELYGLFLGERVTVDVRDAAGKPVQNAHAVLTFGGKTVYSAVTDVNGRAFLFTMGKDVGLDGDVAFTAVAESAAEFTAFASGDTAVTVTADPAAKVQYLDLAFLIDTTGSMGDEIMYLQEELKDVISSVSRSQPNLTVRISMNFYRDEGDDYVVRTNDFTTDLNKAIQTLAAETADGGGDYPEAVDQAMAAVLEKLSWEEDSVKLVYFVLDAPAHSEDDQVIARLQKLIPAYAEQGIRVIPVASSGVDTETEFFLRDLATFTNGTYVFLTDDSGISVGGHLEPTVGEYTVQPLNELLIKITNRYCDGWERTAQPIPEVPAQTGNQQ